MKKSNYFYQDIWCCVCHKKAFSTYMSSNDSVGCACSEQCQSMYDINPLPYGDFKIMVRSDQLNRSRI